MPIHCSWMRSKYSVYRELHSCDCCSTRFYWWYCFVSLHPKLPDTRYTVEYIMKMWHNRFIGSHQCQKPLHWQWERGRHIKIHQRLVQLDKRPRYIQTILMSFRCLHTHESQQQSVSVSFMTKSITKSVKRELETLNFVSYLTTNILSLCFIVSTPHPNKLKFFLSITFTFKRHLFHVLGQMCAFKRTHFFESHKQIDSAGTHNSTMIER